MPKKELVLIASRAISLYLVFWSLGNLANVPSLVFAISHYAGSRCRQVKTMPTNSNSFSSPLTWL